ncbi:MULTISPECIES: DNA primase [Francisella]|uniref:DNA primase n=1 Tax=Francisella opportunistica TaxID=2016517 RepID=A0A345JR49_9GAMM|nr:MULTISPECIES: DNA primase [Francisella]APC91514.1 DNA primase [Francisella sp. MA067296]AXH29795.1 DNA primase [Francisella opportunistica]AXH31445.1 DNA primase [Francisella opportunistica]AXH33091.1 DNA primase [Francisella opportunistica]
MAKKVSNTFIKELVATADIVDVVSRYVNLKKTGKNYKGCCPFHNEKTPSFFVNPEKKFYHCFGCQASGDALTFIKKINNLEFIEAVKTLAEIIGKPVEYENYSQEDIQKEQLYNKCISFLAVAQKYYRWNLGNSVTKDKAINYLKKRGIDSDLARFFGIGYSSEGWNNITELAKSVNVSEEILVDTGLAIKNDKGNLYDRFRGRIMFPIRNIQGNVIAYGGRVIDNSQAVKYINSPETFVFQKNNILYGLYEYRERKKQYPELINQSLVVVEGYMDVVGLAQHGFYAAVAALGTAFSPNHAKILFRETNSVILCFDGDEAGQKAAIRTIKILLPILDGNKKLKILTLPSGDDPDDYIKQYGLEGFYTALDNSLALSEFIVDNLVQGKDLTKAESKAEVLENLKNFLLDVADNIYSESITATLADKVGIKVEQLKNLLKIRKQTSLNVTKQQNIQQKRLAKNLLLEEVVLAELFVNLADFRILQDGNDFEIFATSKNLDILAKSLKILKEDPSNQIEAVMLIQLLAEDYPDYREYFFELLSYGIHNTQKKYAEDKYQEQMLDMLKRVENSSVKKRLKYLGSLPFRTDVQEMERKYLVAKLGNK